MTRIEVDGMGISLIIDGGSPTKSEATYQLTDGKWYCFSAKDGEVDQRTTNNLNDMLKRFMVGAIAETNKIQTK